MNTPSYRNTRTLRLLRALIRSQNVLVGRSCDHIREHWNLPYSEFDLVMTLGNTEGMRMGDIAGRMLTSAPNVTRVVKCLEKKGLVERCPNPTSQREVIARLTSRGETLFHAAYPNEYRFMRAQLDASWSTEEQEEMIALLERILPEHML